MGTSTPLRKSLARKSLLPNTPAVVTSPLRRNSSIQLNPVVLLDQADDEAERSKRRSAVDIHRRLTSISSTVNSPVVEINNLVDEQQIKDHLRICTKLFTENKISTKNAWELHVIDIIRKITSTNSDNVLQAAGSSLDIGAKVYAFRVDDVHTRGLKMASTMTRSNDNQTDQNDDNVNEIELDPQAKKKRGTKKKKISKNKNTVDKEGKTLFAPPKMLEPVLFSTKENIEISATDNLFTYKLHVNPSNQLFMLLSGEKYWTTDDDITLEGADEQLDIEPPDLTKFTLCSPFREFEIGEWDPVEEENQLVNGSVAQNVVLDDDGLPLPELDGSVHNIFENNDGAPDSGSDVEEHQELFRAQIHGEIAHIVDAVPEEKRIETEYGYNALLRTETGKFIDRIWAGPSHWKVKFVRRSAARYSGSTVQQVTKHTKRTKVPEKINFDIDPETLDFFPEKIVIKKAPPTVAFEKITLPVPEISFQNFHEVISQLQTKPGVVKPKLNDKNQQNQEYEIPAYNYENPNDSQYCSQNNIDDEVNNEDEPHTFEEEGAPAACQNFLNTHLVNEPEMVSTNYVTYALQAKKMDMKKLKSVVWKRLTHNSERENESIIQPIQFSQLYKELPDHLSKDMKKELSCHLVFAALLHLCNENNLILTQSPSDCRKDFIIQKAL